MDTETHIAQMTLAIARVAFAAAALSASSNFISVSSVKAAYCSRLSTTMEP